MIQAVPYMEPKETDLHLNAPNALLQPLMKHAPAVIAIGLMTHPLVLIDSMGLMQPLRIVPVGLTMILQPLQHLSTAGRPYRTTNVGKATIMWNALLSENSYMLYGHNNIDDAADGDGMHGQGG